MKIWKFDNGIEPIFDIVRLLKREAYKNQIFHGLCWIPNWFSTKIHAISAYYSILFLIKIFCLTLFVIFCSNPKFHFFCSLFLFYHNGCKAICSFVLSLPYRFCYQLFTIYFFVVMSTSLSLIKTIKSDCIFSFGFVIYFFFFYWFLWHCNIWLYCILY